MKSLVECRPEELRLVGKRLHVVLEVVYSLGALTESQSVFREVVSVDSPVQGLQREGEGRVEQSQLLVQLVDLQGKDGVVYVHRVSQDEELFVAEKDIVLLCEIEQSLEEGAARSLYAKLE